MIWLLYPFFSAPALFFVFTGYPQPGATQHPLYYNFSDENVLPTNEVFEMVQDDFGMIWLATNSGLYRFDGVRTVRYSSSVSGTRSIVNVFLDSRQQVWCRSGSRSLFRVEGDSLRIMQDNVRSGQLRFCRSDDSGGFLSVRKDTLYLFRSDSSLRHSFLLPDDISGQAVLSDVRCRERYVYVSASPGGLYRLDTTTGKSEKIIPLSIKNSLWLTKSGNRLFVLVMNLDDRIQEVSELKDSNVEPIFRYAASELPERWHRMCAAPEGGLWICTSWGVFLLEEKNGSWKAGPRLLQDFSVSCALTDREGLTWYASLNRGIAVISSPDISRISVPGGTDRAVFSALTILPSGEVLAGNSSGDIFRIDPNTLSARLTYHNQTNILKIAVKKMLIAGDELLLARGRISIADPESDREFATKHSNARDMEVVDDTLYGVFPDRVLRVPLAGMRAGSSLYETLYPQGGRALEKDAASGDLYVACNDGLHFISGKKMTPVLWKGQSIHANALAAGNSGVWASVPGVGIFLLKSGKAELIHAPQGSREALDFRTLCFRNDTLYFSTEKKMVRLSVNDGMVKTWSGSAGFNPNSINDIAVSGNRIWLATTGGLITMPLTVLPESRAFPTVRIAGAELGGRNLPVSGTIVVPPGANNLRILFEGTSFRSRQNFTFRYRMRGYDDTWLTASAAGNYVVYSALPPGEYTFELVTQDENGVSSPDPASLKVRVERPFLLNPWGIALMLLLTFAFAMTIFLFILRGIRRRAAFRQQYIGSQLTALKAQMNPHFMFNALNSIQDLVIRKDIRNSNLYLTKFSSLMRQVLNASGRESVRLSDEMEMLRLYLDLEQLRFGDELQVSMEAEGSLEPDEIYLPSMIIQPFVENALKHGLLHRKGEKRLAIRFIIRDHLECVITDNGIGRKRSAEIRERGKAHSSFSTSATLKRLDLLRSLYKTEVNIDILDLQENGEAAGTEVRLRLPFMNPDKPFVK